MRLSGVRIIQILTIHLFTLSIRSHFGLHPPLPPTNETKYQTNAYDGKSLRKMATEWAVNQPFELYCPSHQTPLTIDNYKTTIWGRISPILEVCVTLNLAIKHIMPLAAHSKFIGRCGGETRLGKNSQINFRWFLSNTSSTCYGMLVAAPWELSFYPLCRFCTDSLISMATVDILPMR